MAIFAPIIDENKLNQGNVYVYNFWDFNPLRERFVTNPGVRTSPIFGLEGNAFFPKNMTFDLVVNPFNDNKNYIIATPNSVVQVMSKKQYETLVKNTKIELAQIFIQFASDPNPFDLTRTLYPAIGISFKDLDGKELIDYLISDNGPLFGDRVVAVVGFDFKIPGPYTRFLPQSIPTFDKNGPVPESSLYVTYCSFNAIKQLAPAVFGFEDFRWIDALVQCGKCLPYEAEYMEGNGYKYLFWDNLQLKKK